MQNMKGLLLIVSALICTLPIFAEGIVFADSNVKALCVANWDSDSDGELSMEEAATVTTLGSVFREKNGIVSFGELRYFTGLSMIDSYAFYKSSIETIELPSSVTRIGDYAFSQSNIAGELHIPGTVKDISRYAFYNCKNLTGVVLEEGVQTIGYSCFSGPIAMLSLPASLTYIYNMAINPFASGDSSSGIFVPEGDLYVYAHGTTPAAINQFAFYYVFGEAHLVVPFGSMEAYKAEPGWSHFGEYLQYGDVNSDGNVNNRDVISLRSYILGNNPTPFNVNVADVNGDGTINNRDVILLRNSIMNQ